MRGLIAFIFVVSAVLAALWWKLERSLNDSERYVFERLEDAVAGNSPSLSGIASAFGLPADCAAKGCYFDQSQVANPAFAAGRLHPGQDRLIFVLEKAKGQCIRVDRAISHFGAGELEEACVHGGCWYFRVQHRWGILGFGLENPKAVCVESVVINSSPEQRPRNDAARRR